MSNITQYAKNKDEKKLLTEISNQNGMKCLCRHNGKLLIAFCGYKPQLSNGTITTNIDIQIQHQAMKRLNAELNKNVNPQLWTIGYAAPPNIKPRSNQF